jgi:hypothetical protein
VSSGSTPWWRRRQRERFARAADALPEPDQSSDPRLAGELAVVVMLRRTAEATAPDSATRDRMKSAVLARLAAQPAEPAPAARQRHRPARRTRVTGTRGRLAIALGVAFCLVVALSGMTLLLSRNALPGDTLYAVRRTVESASLGFTSGDDGRGRKHLEFAADRIGDIQSLAARNPDPADSPVGDYLTAFADFDTDASAGTADLTGYAADNGDAVLTTLRSWAAQQADRIKQVEPALPDVARTRAAHSVTLLSRIVARANAIAARVPCYTITSGAVDDLGVLPATDPCDKAPGSANTGHTGGAVGSARTRVPPNSVATRSAESGAGRAAVPTPATTSFPAPPVVFPPPILGTSPGPVTTVTGSPRGTLTLPLPLPGITVPPLLPGLPTLRIGQ